MTNEQTERLICALEKISQGGESGSAGLEMLAIALAGNGLEFPLGRALDRIAEAIDSLADEMSMK